VTPPRLPLAVLPTPLVRARRLEAALGCGPVLLKRDDLIGFAVAGNKTRSLEYLLGTAVAQGYEVLVTGGGPGSNFCAAAAIAAGVAGLDCELVVWGDTVGGPNLAMATAAGACIHRTVDDRREHVDAAVQELAGQLAESGRRPFSVPRGGSTGLGAVGFATAAAELAGQLETPPELVVLAVGSGGSCAGLLAGMAAGGWRWPVVGVSVSRPPAEITARVHELAAECAAILGTPPPSTELLEVVDGRGPGFGIASPADRAAARLALHTEGVLLDDTYGAKAFAVMLERLAPTGSGPVVYWHTGGVAPALEAISAGIGDVAARPCPAASLNGGAQ